MSSSRPPSIFSAVAQSAFLSVGFRPFFFFGILFSALSGLLWAWFWSPLGQSPFFSTWQPLAGMAFWHAHEMINGFVFAIIAGFLLTAVQNWTGMKTVNGLGLLALLGCWIVARVVFALSASVPFAWLLVTQLLPILGLMLAIGRPIVLTRLWRNLFVVAALALWAINEGQVLIAARNNEIAHGLLLAQLYIVLLYIAMIAGRVVPFFMANRLGIPKAVEPKWQFIACIAPLVLMILNLSTFNHAGLNTVLLGVLAVAHALRLRTWHHKSIWQEPMLYSLLLAYASLPVALLMMVADRLFALSWGAIPLHVLTLGTMGALIVAMVGRVSLGHTGRSINAVPAIRLGLILVLAALIVRTALPLMTGWHPAVMALSAALWAAAFLVMFGYFAKIWWLPRPDGR